MQSHLTIRNLALSAAAVILASEDAAKLTGNFVAARGAIKRGPHRAAVLIKTLFKREEINAWPPIGSSVKDFPASYNGPVDRYSYEEWSENANKTVKRSGSFINDMADACSAKAKAAIEALDGLAPLFAKDAVDPAKIPARYQHLIGNKAEAARLKTDANNDLKAARELWRDGIRIVQQEYLFERFKSVRIEYAKDADGNLTNAQAPITIIDVASPHKAQPFTVGGFLSLDPNEAEDNFLSIIKTTRKGKGADEPANGKTGSIPKNTTEAMGALNNVANFFDTEENRRAYKLALTTGNQADRDAFILAIGSISDFADTYMADPVVYARYKELKGQATDKAELKAKQAKAGETVAA